MAFSIYATATADNLSPLTPPLEKFFFPSLRSYSLYSKTIPKPCRHLHAATQKPLVVAAAASKNHVFDVRPIYKDEPADHSFAFYFDDNHNDRPREECSVVGIYGDLEAFHLWYLALHALQHHGQEGAGIVSVHDNVLQHITGVELVSDVFNESKLDKLPSEMAIGHVRYSTAGSSMLKNVQPFVVSYKFGSVGVAHNGNLVNYEALHAALEEYGSIFNTTSDTEVILHLIAISKERLFILRIIEA